MNALSLGLLGLLATAAGAAAQSDIAPIDPKIYPPAQAGEQRLVLPLAPAPEEAHLMIEVVAGQKMEVDCNRVMIAAKLEALSVEGWGYGYFRISEVSPPASTAMACPEGRKSEATVPLLLGPTAFDRYNSKLPLVIYAPEGLKIGYRLWQSDGQIHSN